MKLTKTMIAVAALAGSSSLFAAPAADRIVRISGASAVKNNLTLELQTLCAAGGGALREWRSGSSISTYVCFDPAEVGRTSGTGGTYATAPSTAFINFSGTTYAEVRLNVVGGSFTSLTTLTGGVDTYLNPGLGATTVAGNTPPANGASGGGLETGLTGVGGYSDVNWEAYAQNVRDSVPNLETAVLSNKSVGLNVAQGFGVAVSDALYGVMFTAQQTAGTIPATCAVTSTADRTCVPSISKAQMASIMSGSATSAGKTQGVRFLAPQVAAGLELRYVRRVDTSGTQAAAQNYFLGLGNMTTPRTVIADPSDRVTAVINNVTSTTGICNVSDIVGPGAFNQEADAAFVADGQFDLCDRKFSNLRVLAAPGTGDVRNELNKATIQGGATNYAIAVMSLENDQATFVNTAPPATSPTTWKWLRVQGAMPGENAKPGTAGNTNRNTLLSGEYDFYYQLWSFSQSNPSTDALFDAINAGLLTGPALKGLTVIGNGATQQPWTRGGRTDTPSAR